MKQTFDYLEHVARWQDLWKSCSTCLMIILHSTETRNN